MAPDRRVERPLPLLRVVHCVLTDRGKVMIHGFFGRVSSADQLREGLDVGSQRTRAIADRVANATLAGRDGFALPDPNAPESTVPAAGEPVDLETEMVNLADQQLRF